MSPLAVSILDLVPVRSGQTSTDAVAASVALARCADKLGFTRYWMGEHHNVPSVASTNPAVLLGLLAGVTSRIRLGSGGVMLPNHSPLVVAEQFALLEAAAPGRIDLGIGRAPGSDSTVTGLLHSTGHASDVGQHASSVQQIQAMASPAGVTFRQPGGGHYNLFATPAATSSPEIWLLGTSDYSARLAARLGLPYALAHQSSEAHTSRLLDLYRSQFTPNDRLLTPKALLTVTLVVADTEKEARRLALPQVHHMARLSSGTALGPMDTVEAAAKSVLRQSEAELANALLDTLFIGEAEAVADRLTTFTSELGIDEVMVSPAAGGSHSDPSDRYPTREHILDLLASRLMR